MPLVGDAMMARISEIISYFIWEVLHQHIFESILAPSVPNMCAKCGDGGWEILLGHR